MRFINVGAQAFIMMLAGYETTAAALSFTLYLLAANPDKQQLLVEEVTVSVETGCRGWRTWSGCHSWMRA
jgi:cytochrome P450